MSCDAVYNTAKSAALSPAKEENALLPGSDDKPADVLLPNYASGKPAALDVTVVSPLQQQLVKKAAEEPGSAARKRFQEKQAKYQTPCKNEGIEFFPLSVETLGGWHPESLLVLKNLARHLASHSGNTFEETQRHFLQRLSILLMRGNSALILSRHTTQIDAKVDGDLDI